MRKAASASALTTCSPAVSLSFLLRPERRETKDESCDIADRENWRIFVLPTWMYRQENGLSSAPQKHIWMTDRNRCLNYRRLVTSSKRDE